MCIYRRRRHKNNTTFLHFSQPWPWTSKRFTENAPVALADVLDSSANGKDQIDLQVEPTPGVHYIHSVHTYLHRYNNIMYIIIHVIIKQRWISQLKFPNWPPNNLQFSMHVQWNSDNIENSNYIYTHHRWWKCWCSCQWARLYIQTAFPCPCEGNAS